MKKLQKITLAAALPLMMLVSVGAKGRIQKNTNKEEGIVLNMNNLYLDEKEELGNATCANFDGIQTDHYINMDELPRN